MLLYEKGAVVLSELAIVQPVCALSKDDVHDFWAKGFLALDAVVLPNELEEVRILLDPLFDRIDTLSAGPINELGVALQDGSRSIAEINGTTRLEPQLLATTAFARCHALASDLLGVPTRFGGDHAIYKSAHSPHDTAWHQDQAYSGHGLIARGVTVWLPLQEVTEATGGMRFVPGSHLRGLMHHRRLNGDPTAHALEVVAADTAGAISCPLPAGGATIHLSLTLHSAGPNHAEVPRRAWILYFAVKKGFQIRRFAQWSARKLGGFGFRI